MSIDAELISSENFNYKFKNYLNGFYVYQFMEKNKDYKSKGNKIESKIIRPVSPGKVVVSARTKNGLEANCEIEVKSAPKSHKVYFAETEMSVCIGEIKAAELLCVDETQIENIEWESSSPEIVSVSNGLITAKSIGNAKIRATVNGKKAECKVAVCELPTDVKFKVDKLNLAAGTIRKISIEVTPKNSNKTIQWQTTDETVAKVVSGKINAIGPGSCEIIATTVNGITAKCQVSVSGERVQPDELKLDYETVICNVGEEIRLTAFVLPDNTSELEVEWSSSNKNVAFLTDDSTLGMIESKLLNKNIIDSMFNYDSDRLRSALEEAAGVQWHKGDYVDLKNGIINPDKENKKVECITIDSRTINSNPFHLLYKHCSETTNVPGMNYSILYLLLLYFNLGKGIEFTVLNDSIKELALTKAKENNCRIQNWKSISEVDRQAYIEIVTYDILNEILKLWAADIAAQEHKNSGEKLTWNNLSDKDKKKYAEKVIEAYERDHTEYDRISDGVSKENEIIYEYITLNKKRIVYENGTFKLKNDLRNFVEISTLFYVVNHYDKFKGNQQKPSDKRKQFVNKLKDLTDLGILVSQKIDNKVYYALSDICIDALMITENEDYLCRFSDMLSFFSEVTPLGEAGDYLLNRLEMTKSANLFYKHHYLKSALNDYNIIDLLYAIKNELWIDVEYRNSSVNDMKYQRFLCYPIEIRESVNDGRQYLIYYHPGYRSISALRIEFIDTIIIGKYKTDEYFKNDLANAKILINHTWGTAFSDFKNGNVKSAPMLNKVRLVIQCSEKEDFIRRRAEREFRAFSKPRIITYENIGRCIEFVIEVVNSKEMTQWLRSYITRIVVLEINGKNCLQFTDEMARLYQMYCAPLSDLQKTTDSANSDKINMMESIDSEKFTPKESIHILLFNEFFSFSFDQTGEVLDQFLCGEELTDDCFEDYLSDYVKVDEDKTKKGRKNIHVKQLSNFADTFVKKSEGKNTSIFKLSRNSKIGSIKELLPMTKVEIQWILSVLRSPLSNCFLHQAEKDAIIANVKSDAWNEIFDINSIIYYDQFLDVKDVYSSDSVSDISRRILKALHRKHKINVTYEDQYGRRFTDVCSPAYIEYSKRDNRFRLQVVCGDNTIKTFNFERIKEVNIIPDSNYKHKYVKRIARESVKQHELHVVFTGDKNVPDRILTEFSCYKKRCVKWGDDTYRMILTYEEPDTKEIVIRLLSYGASVCVYNDTGKVRQEMIERIEHQVELINTIQISVEESGLERE